MKNMTPLLLLFLAACSTKPSEQTADASNVQLTTIKQKNFSDNQLDKYWYQGKAEVSRYELQQNRYRDVHPGEVVMIFVTEDFLTDKQVKNDLYRNPNSINILKNNIVKRFTTGLYDYSIMTSVFTPVNTEKYPKTLKITTSTQDWCGHTFMQINWQKNQYKTQVYSYFENEADQSFSTASALLEDELFTRVRLNGSDMPLGKIKILPSLSIARLLHTNFEPLDAEASLQPYEGSDFEGQALQSYKVNFIKSNRTLEIVFENKQPFIIAGWKEKYPSFDGKVRETVAKRTKTILTPYWQENGLEDTGLRKELGISGL